MNTIQLKLNILIGIMLVFKNLTNNYILKDKIRIIKGEQKRMNTYTSQ